MKLIISILFLIVQLAGIFAATVSDSAAECGSLGVMSTDNLPASVIAAGVRKCADHPLGEKRDGVQSLAPMSKADLTLAAANAHLLASHGVQKDACYFAAPFGCSDGHCWKACGPSGRGHWCWLAANGGAGNWIKCTTHEQCGILRAPGYDCGRNCKQGSNACGCNCH